MGNARGTCRTGRRTDTGLVGEQASLDSVHDRGAREAAEDRAEIKCISENVRKYGRNHRYVRHNHKQDVYKRQLCRPSDSAYKNSCHT